METEVVIASSPTDAGISCWDLHSGPSTSATSHAPPLPTALPLSPAAFLPPPKFESPSHRHRLGPFSIGPGARSNAFGLIVLGPQVEVRSFPAEPIKPLVSNSQGTYIAGGGVSGDIYFWEVATGKLLKKWHAHYRAVSCLVFNDDESLLISGAEDGSVRVWSLFLYVPLPCGFVMLPQVLLNEYLMDVLILLQDIDDARREGMKHLFEYSFHEHSLRVTDVKTGYGGSNAIILSASEDRTCKVWSLSKGKILRNVVFPSIIDAISLDPGEHVFYAGGRDGKIYIAGLNSPVTSNSNYGLHIVGALSEHSKGVTCLASSADGFLLVSGSEDGMIRVWDTRTRNVIRVFRHTKGPVNNVLVIRQPKYINPRTSATSLASAARRQGLTLPPPLEKFANSPDENPYVKVLIGPQTLPHQLLDSPYISVQTMEAQMKELQQQGSSAAAEVDVERLKSEQLRSVQMIQQWKKMYENLHQFCVSELVEGSHSESPNGQNYEVPFRVISCSYTKLKK
ncbi:UNVERIFIED_CONTAM: protein ROOT INITIATION defective [Sesamum radiatum]|uniref:Protein ROOT INITIATION defective n=1 Tax=Sesamum radiatum TaxID=300843 RepID=A0AAW2JC89_SESRA